MIKEKKLIIRALTLFQPWAWAVAAGLKTIENRSWPPYEWLLKDDIDCWIAIHAGAKYEQKGLEFLTRHKVALSPEGSRIKGAILGVGRLKGFVSKREHPNYPDPMFFGPYGWQLSDLRLLTQPLYMPGSMGLWQVPDAQLHPLITAIKHNPNQGDLFGGKP